MADFFVDPEILRGAVLDRRFAGLARVGTDLGVLTTWNPHLSRRYRILVPADVQAYVVTADTTEVTVGVTGDRRDPAPFATGAVKPVGVHLHWAMPDALLRGENVDNELVLPPLPDLWVLVRTVFPSGARQAVVRGWVIHAPTGAVSDLGSFAGTPGPAPAGSPLIEPLDGASGGSPHWTASYAASAGRFAFHDPLTDLGAGELFGNQAVYSVAGWWSDLAHDPLGSLAGMPALDAKLAELGWTVVHDGDDEAIATDDPRLVRTRARSGLAQPAEAAPVRVTGADGRLITEALDDVRFDVASPIANPAAVYVGPALPRYATLVHGSVLGVPIGGPLPDADDRPGPDALGLALGLDTDDVASAFAAAALQLAPDQRRNAETLVAAFTGGLLEQLGAPDGLDDLAEHEHEDGFWPLAGTALPSAKADRLRAEDSAAAGPLKVGRKGRAGTAPTTLGSKLSWSRSLTVRDRLSAPGDGGQAPRSEETVVAALGAEQADVREVVRPAPRYFRPQPPMLALRGARPNHRHHGDGLYDDKGLLRCRYPKECVPGIDGVVSGADVVPTLGSGAVPDEALALVREAVLLNPYGYQWLAAAGAADDQVRDSYTARLAAEMVLLYGTEGRYDGSSHLPAPVSHAANGGAWEASSVESMMIDRATGPGTGQVLAGHRHPAQPGGAHHLAPALGTAVGRVATDADRLGVDGRLAARSAGPGTRPGSAEPADTGLDPAGRPKPVGPGHLEGTAGRDRQMGRRGAHPRRHHRHRPAPRGRADPRPGRQPDRTPRPGLGVPRRDPRATARHRLRRRDRPRRRPGRTTEGHRHPDAAVRRHAASGHAAAGGRVRTHPRRPGRDDRRGRDHTRSGGRPARPERCGCARASRTPRGGCSVWSIPRNRPVPRRATCTRRTSISSRPTARSNPVAGFLLPDHIDEELEAFEVDGSVIGQTRPRRDQRRRDVGARARSTAAAGRRPARRPGGACADHRPDRRGPRPG